MGALLKQYGWALRILFVVLLAYFLAKITNIYVASLLEVSRSIGVVSSDEPAASPIAMHDPSEYELVISRNIFDSSEQVSETGASPDCTVPENAGLPECEGTGTPTGEAVKTGLGIKLTAVMVIGDGKDKRSSATVEASGAIDVYAVGDDKKTFAPGVRLVQVKPTRIEFVHGGRLEYAELDQGLNENIFGPPRATVASSAASGAPAADGAPKGEKVAKLGENKFALDQVEIDAALTNLDKLYTEIRAVPNFQDGKVQGMKILSIKPGSIFAKLGLKRGDVLARINGFELDIKSGFQIFNQLKDQRSFNLDLQREGKNQTFEYEIR
ncbi:MAG: hypothetical protein HY543_02765 [Deltaproteobacteria bacterium]|nr:hypothetical protein [Deltaproteobacteria bacterium]